MKIKEFKFYGIFFKIMRFDRSNGNLYNKEKEAMLCRLQHNI